MKRNGLIAGLLVVFLLGIGFSSVSAQTPQPPSPAGMPDRPETPIRDILTSLVAEKLGLTADQLQQRIKDGETLPEIARSKGFDLTAFEAMMKDTRQKALTQAVTDGVITQDQADRLAEGFAEKDGLQKTRLDALAEGLGMSAADLQQRIYNGDRLVDIAAEKGLDTEALKALVQSVREKMVDQAVADGKITQERADRLKKRIENAPALREAGLESLASDLGMTSDELTQSLRGGQKLRDIAADKGVSVESFKEMLKNAADNAVDAAVTRGILTQVQADKIKEKIDSGANLFNKNPRGLFGRRGR
jgi:uncharacterized protein YidB (DUF937 family)